MESSKKGGKSRKKSFSKIMKHKTLRKRNIFSVLSVILTIILIIFVSIMNFLPLKYTIIISIVLLVIDLLSILLINVHKKIVLKIIGTIILVLSIASSVLGIYYLNSTNRFISKSFVSKDIYSKSTYYVLAKKANNLSKSDIDGDIATYKETINLDKALKKLTDKYSVKEHRYEDLIEMFNSIKNDENKFMLIEKSSYEIVFSIDTTLVKDEYDIVLDYDVYTKKKSTKNTSTEKFNIYIGGTDFAGLMDFNMIVSVNMETHEAVLTSIPRDYYIEVVGKNGRYDKLSFMNAYGPSVNKESLEKLFNTNIDYSIIINTDSLVEVVDYVGGIDFCSDYNFTTTHALVADSYNDNGRKLTIKKGCQRLDGIETLTVARERNAFPGRDRVRQENCQKIMLEIFKKLISTDTILHYNETLNTLGSLYETDIPKEVITNTAKDILNNGNKWNIKTQSVDGEDGHDKVHLSNMTDWVMYPNKETVQKASNTIQETLK